MFFSFQGTYFKQYSCQLLFCFNSEIKKFGMRYYNILLVKIVAVKAWTIFCVTKDQVLHFTGQVQNLPASKSTQSNLRTTYQSRVRIRGNSEYLVFSVFRPCKFLPANFSRQYHHRDSLLNQQSLMCYCKECSGWHWDKLSAV